ncbi:MAG TPA: ATP-binding protein [Candidatus Saccharimonadales bacterium]|nr:ATP-binding protein [Candidatus Saccharimonadales bacterium]
MVKSILTRRSAAREAQLDHERLTSLVNSMADGVLAVDTDMRIVMGNGAAQNILDVNSSLREHKLGKVLHMQDKNAQPVDIEKLVSKTTTPTSNRDMLIKYADGSLINVYLSIAPVHLGYGGQGQQGYVLLLRDITHEKSLEEERDEFISVISHELRTPIAIAEGNISNAQFITEHAGHKRIDPKQVVDALKQAHDQILFLSDLINDLATLSRAERGKLDVDVTSINVKELLQDLQKNYAPQAKAKKLTLTALAAKDVSTLDSSKLYVREILQNFITNALKYTDKGSITIVAEAADKGVRFKIIDTGIGISKGDQEKLFDKFFRSEDFRTRKTNGTGLGLYVTLKLARLIHADIDVESELDKGSTFSIFIPNLGS